MSVIINGDWIISATTTIDIARISATAGATTTVSGTQNTAITSFSPFSSVTGGYSPYTYYVSAGTLPTGITLNPSTGLVSGTPTAAYSTASVTFSVQDANQQVAVTTSTVSFTIIVATNPANYIVVGGGGGGGGSYMFTPYVFMQPGITSQLAGGGGGGGQVLTGTAALLPGTPYSIVVGGGGGGGCGAYGSVGPTCNFAGQGTPSSFYCRVAVGGCGGSAGSGTAPKGPCKSNLGGKGGNGGRGSLSGAASSIPGGAYQYRGGSGGGGSATPGVGTAASNQGGAGGAGLLWPQTGPGVYYGNGASGGSAYCIAPGVPPSGTGRGGYGRTPFYPPAYGVAYGAPTAGGTNIGQGGGGNGGTQGPPSGPACSFGMAGGSGVVILAIPTPTYTGVYSGGPVVVSNPPAAPGQTVLKFTGSGTYTA